jgi:hypothetical protein
MRKFQIIGIIVCLVLVAGMTIFQIMRNRPETTRRTLRGNSITASQQTITQEVTGSQETQILNVTQETTMQATQEEQSPVPTRQIELPPPGLKGPLINRNKIEERFTKAPYSLKFVHGRNAKTNQKTSLAISGDMKITTSGSTNYGLNSARITVPLKRDYSNIGGVFQVIGDFAKTINQNIADNDNQILKNMFEQIKTPVNAGGQTTKREEAGLSLTLTISGSSGGGGGSAGSSGDGGSNGSPNNGTSGNDTAGDESLTLIIEQPVTTQEPETAPKIEDIKFLSDSLNKNAATGGWEITGELVNSGTSDITGIQVRAVLYDVYNAVLDTQNGFVANPVLNAGTKSSFLIHIPNPPADYDNYELSIPPAG